LFVLPYLDPCLRSNNDKHYKEIMQTVFIDNADTISDSLKSIVT